MRYLNKISTEMSTKKLENLITTLETNIQEVRELIRNKHTGDIVISDDSLWNSINAHDFIYFENFIKYILLEYGTSQPCNRFDIGNSLEFAICDELKSMGYEIDELPNAKRIDLCINNTYQLSIKYSSGGDITLHNSNSSINKDCTFTDLLLLTPKSLYLLTKDNIGSINIDINEYLVNTGDSLKLKRSLLTELDKLGFRFRKLIDLNIDKKNCRHQLCAKKFYEMAKMDYTQSIE